MAQPASSHSLCCFIFALKTMLYFLCLGVASSSPLTGEVFNRTRGWKVILASVTYSTTCGGARGEFSKNAHLVICVNGTGVPCPSVVSTAISEGTVISRTAKPADRLMNVS